MAFQTQQSQHLYPALGDQVIPLRPAGVGETELTQDDLDRIWKPIFEDYNGGEGCCEGCTTRKLRIPLSNLKDLLATLPTADDVEGQQQQQQRPQLHHLSRRNRQRATQIQQRASHLPMPRWVLELVTKQADVDRDGWVEYQEFCDIVLQHKGELTSTHLKGLEKFVQDSVNSVTPAYYDEYYGRCCPPPLFIPLISLVEIAVFVWYCVEYRVCSANEPVPVYSPLFYDPNRRTEAWRFFSYMLVHAGIVHIVMNILIQLLLGIPLELVHKGWRIMLVYILGALIGGLAHSVTDFNTFLCGASGGVYALVGAHVANVLMNFKEMRFGIVRSVVLGILIVADVALALYKRYAPDQPASQVGYMAHLGGFVGGLFLGVVCLKNLKVRSWERVLWYVSLIVLLIMLLVGVLVNTFYDGYPTEDKRPLNEYFEDMKRKHGPN